MNAASVEPGGGAASARASELDTIAAIATPPGPGRRAALRLSGPRAHAIAAAAFEPAPPLARGCTAGSFRDGHGRLPALCVVMPGPRSYTGEDVVEIHVPGAPALVAQALLQLVELGARPAQPGEFTRRAFLAGRMDLARAEAVAALVGATHAAAHRAAVRLFAGGLGKRAQDAAERILEARVLVEASLDFDESDTGAVPRAELAQLLERAAEQIGAAQDELIAAGGASGLPRVALAGAPNAGKSSLFNALVGAAALVDATAGTTRDVLSARWSAAGVEVELLDLPGFDAQARGVDKKAQDNAREALRGADVVLVLASARAAMREAEQAAGFDTALAALPAGPTRIFVWSQIDAAGARRAPVAGPPEPPEFPGPGRVVPVMPVSARTGAGLVELAAAVRNALGRGVGESGPGGNPPALSESALSESAGGLARELHARHRAALDGANGEFLAARAALASEGPMDLVAAHLAAAAEHLSDLSGRTTSEDVLDRIFARFCLGK